MFSIEDEEVKFYGTVALVSADNPASAALGGFKESSSAFRCCRHCLGTLEDIKVEVLCSYMLRYLGLIIFIFISLMMTISNPEITQIV